MATQKEIEGLSVRMELALWKGRCRIYGARRKVLSSEFVLKKDVVERMERSLLKHFSLFGGSYEEQRTKAQWEMNEAKKAYEQVLHYMEEGEKKISELERQAIGLGQGKMSLEDKEQEDPSLYKGGTTEESLIRWCELVEDGSALADSITSFLADLVVYMDHNNSGRARTGEGISLQNSLFQVEDEAKAFYNKLRQDYEKMGMDSKIKKYSVYGVLLTGRGNLGQEMQENAMLYMTQTKMQELQKRLAETFAAMEDDGMHLLERLKRESAGAEESSMAEKEIGVEKTKGPFSKSMDNQNKNMEGQAFSYYKVDQPERRRSTVFPEMESAGQENINQEKEKLIEGIHLLQEELKTVRADLQNKLKKSRFSLFGKHSMVFDEREDVPEEIKKLEKDIEGWRRLLKEFRRKTKHFPCAVDNFVSMESKCMARDFEMEDAMSKPIWYLSYLDELEQKMKNTEQQVKEFTIDI